MKKVSLFVAEHPYQFDLAYLRVKYPDAAVLGDMILEYTTNICVKEDYLLFDAAVSRTINYTEESCGGNAYCDISQWLVVSCDAVIADKVEALDIVSVS